MTPVDGLVAALERIAAAPQLGEPARTHKQIAAKALTAYHDAISPAWSVGDRVIATGHRAVILALSPDLRFAWLQPESGQPWSVLASEMRRAPPEPRERPSDTEAAE